ncbi:hypothetical protein BT67DRAFT_463428 [Trichocladium antarcticum]|uniref:Protein YAE1 n=1 Tax=Trichocladium antarcticum TaxID=1450529 RepID=A0AAN6ZCW6_9PEZI|nr:hypothetical protein BT67DRAFT_463428 [Trichocladium antarcticum]
MLLRAAPTPDRDPDIFHTMTSHTPAPPDTSEDNAHGNTTTTDDVWGTSPPIHQPFYAPPHHHHHDHHQHPSDIPRLSQAHTNAGYRDGITLAKARTAQAGFDEGYGLGATIGARAGQLLGVLEGLAAAVGLHSLSQQRGSGRGGDGGGDGGADEGKEEAARLGALLAEARRELSVRGGGLVVFADVAAAHPLVRKWDGIVRGEAERYGVDLEVLKDEVGPWGRRVEDGAGEVEEPQRAANRARRDAGSTPAVRAGGQLTW